MSLASSNASEWSLRRERGALPLIKLMVWLARRLGRRGARLLLSPICAYFLLFSPQSRRASRDYLRRVLPQPPGLADIFRHYHCFAACILDRVFLLNDEIERFEIEVHGEEVVKEVVARGSGCILMGAHFGSFEVVRAMGRRQPDIAVSLVMYEENARKIGTVLKAINPALALEIVALRKFDTMLGVQERLGKGHFVGMLADRGCAGEEMARHPFLGAPAAFPRGPFRMAALLKTPTVLMFGIYRGGRRYAIHFERLEPSAAEGGPRRDAVDAMMRGYVERLEHHCRNAPFNWFNFYDFWQ